MPMPLYPTWEDIFIRLVLTLAAGAIVGFNRGVGGHAAGLRTTILVGLAACVSMIQANILLSIGGKAPDSFGVMDLMRLPLGILTGVGFIGGGAILKRGNSIAGLTTAATLWIITMIGLCFGGGQLGLGILATGLAIMILWAMERLEARIPRRYRATLVVTTDSDRPALELDQLIRPSGHSARLSRRGESNDPRRVEMSFEIVWKQREIDAPSLDFLKLIEPVYSVKSIDLGAGADH